MQIGETEMLNIDLQHALQRQKQAFLNHTYPSLAERKADLRRLLDFVLTHQEGLCAAVSADYGHRARHETMITEIIPTIDSLRHTLKHLRKWMRVQKRGVDWTVFAGAKNRLIPQPLGVVGVIVPWNFPINLSLIPLCYIFAAGNRAMVKMSENSRHLAAYLQQHLSKYFTPDKLHISDESGGVGIAFSKLAFDHLLFTGSGQTGRAVMRAAAENLVPVTLELGGKAPAIIAPDFPLRTAVERIMYVKCLNAGQICTTVDYLWLPEQSLAEFVSLAREIVQQRYRDIASDDYTALINPAAYQRLLAALQQARQDGAEVISLLPGESQDQARHKLAPHLVLNASPDSELLQREIFGPILPIKTYRDIQEVFDDLKAKARPLAIYPFSHNKALIQRFIDELMSGGVSVNDCLFHVAQHDLPFGGVGESGMGHYHGYEGFVTFSKMRPVFYQSRFAMTKLLAPPYRGWLEKLFALKRYF